MPSMYMDFGDLVVLFRLIFNVVDDHEANNEEWASIVRLVEIYVMFL